MRLIAPERAEDFIRANTALGENTARRGQVGDEVGRDRTAGNRIIVHDLIFHLVVGFQRRQTRFSRDRSQLDCHTLRCDGASTDGTTPTTLAIMAVAQKWPTAPTISTRRR